MTCGEARERMAELWMSPAEDAGRREVEEHVAGCAVCREEAAVLGALWVELGDLPLEAPSPQLRAGFYHMLEAYRLGERGVGKPPLKRRWDWLHSLWPSQPAVQLAMAGLALVFGLVAGHLYTARSHDQQRIAQLQSEMQSMRQLVALSLLQQQSASERLRGVNYSVRMEPAGEEVLAALLQTLNHDANVNVRLAAVDALRQFSSRAPVRRGLREAIARQDSPLVQIALIEWAVDARDLGSAPQLERLAAKGELHPAVKARLDEALRGLHPE